MTSAQLYDGILNEFNMMQSSKRKNIALFGKRAVKLIEEAKKEWCKEQRNLCAKESLGFFDNKKAFINIILNAPEPN